MSASLKIPAAAEILVADGRKALLLVNEGDAVHPRLKTKQVMEAPENPATAGQGSDKPGRAIASDGRRASMDQTDWHARAEDQFARVVVNALAANPHPKGLIVVAPPRFLATLRKVLPPAVNVTAEIDKDLTHLTVREIEKHLTG